MNNPELIKKRIAVLEREREINQELDVLYAQLDMEVLPNKENTFPKQLDNVKPKQSLKQVQGNLFSKKKERMEPQTTAKILKPYFEDSSTISKQELEKKLWEDHRKKWSNFPRVLTRLRELGILDIQVHNVSGTTFYTLKR